MLKSKFKLKGKLTFIIKLLVSVLSFYYLAIKLYAFDYTTSFKVFSDGENLLFFMLAFLLMPLNWGLEAWKWKVSMENLHPIGFKTALNHIFVGKAVGFFTPGRLGEIAGRAIFVANKQSAMALALTNGVAQNLATFTFGVVGVVFFFQSDIAIGLELNRTHIALSTVLFVVAMPMFFFLRKKIHAFFQQLLPERLPLLISISFIRYIVFVVQFFFAFRAVGVKLDLHLVLFTVGTYYLVNTLLPVFAVAEAGVKAVVGSRLFPLIGVDQSFSLFVPVLVWGINTFVPVIWGNIVLLVKKRE